MRDGLAVVDLVVGGCAVGRGTDEPVEEDGRNSVAAEVGVSVAVAVDVGVDVAVVIGLDVAVGDAVEAEAVAVGVAVEAGWLLARLPIPTNCAKSPHRSDATKLSRNPMLWSVHITLKDICCTDSAIVDGTTITLPLNWTVAFVTLSKESFVNRLLF